MDGIDELIKSISPHEQIQNRLIHVQSAVKHGEMNPLAAVIELRKYRKHLENSLALIKDFEIEYYEEIQNEAEKYQNQYDGFKFEFRNGRKTYDFKSIPEWQSAEKYKKEIEAKYKSMLQAKINGAPHANVSEDGEELPLPEVKYSKSSLIIKRND